MRKLLFRYYFLWSIIFLLILLDYGLYRGISFLREEIKRSRNELREVKSFLKKAKKLKKLVKEYKIKKFKRAEALDLVLKRANLFVNNFNGKKGKLKVNKDLVEIEVYGTLYGIYRKKLKQFFEAISSQPPLVYLETLSFDAKTLTLSYKVKISLRFI